MSDTQTASTGRGGLSDNAHLLGSSPTSGASFIGDFDNSCSPGTLLTQNKALFDQTDVSK